MSQSDIHPLDASRLLRPAVGTIIQAVSDRGDQSDEAYHARVSETEALLASFQSRDVIDLMLVGQLIAFNEVFADATRDVLRGMVDTMKQRTQSNLIAMGRLTQGHVDRLEKRGNHPFQAKSVSQPELAPQAVDAAAGQSAPQVEPAPAHQPEPHAPAVREPPAHEQPIVGAPVEEAPVEESPAEEKSWLDEPYQEWLIETPADVAARAEAALVTARVEAALMQVARAHMKQTHCSDRMAPPPDRPAHEPAETDPYLPGASPADDMLMAAAAD